MRLGLICTLFAVTTTAAAASTASPAPPPPDRAADAYAIYAVLLPGDTFAHLPPEQTQHWAIAATTLNANDVSPRLEPRAALKAPPSNAAAFNQAVADYQLHRLERWQLEPRFPVQHSYTLMDANQVAAFKQARSSPVGPSGLTPAFAGYPGINFFSAVYFNAEHTAALVYETQWCGHLCAAGEWVYLEKRSGAWTKRSGTAAIRPGG